MAGIPAQGQLPGFTVSPPSPAICAFSAAELQSRLQETLAMLTKQELSKLRVILQRLDDEQRVTQLSLELEGGSASGLASLLAKRYYQSAPHIIVMLLQKLCRADLLSLWQRVPAADGAVAPRENVKRSCDHVDGDLDCYDLSGKRKAFLMCVKTHRPGAHQDVQLMKEWLGSCRFEHTSCIDPDKMDLLEQITVFRDKLNEMKDEISCCIVTLMSHGEQGFIKTKDGEKVSLENIFEMFNNKNCPALQEKPKIFIIQACRGVKRDYGVETDDEPMELDDVCEKRRLPTFSDYFIIYPTQPDHVALRHPVTGSVMIEAMIEVFKDYRNRWHIADFFTKVNSSLVQSNFYLHEEPIKVSLVMESTLTKFVYF